MTKPCAIEELNDPKYTDADRMMYEMALSPETISKVQMGRSIILENNMAG
jgi:hypothetical protein